MIKTRISPKNRQLMETVKNVSTLALCTKMYMNNGQHFIVTMTFLLAHWKLTHSKAPHCSPDASRTLVKIDWCCQWHCDKYLKKCFPYLKLMIEQVKVYKMLVCVGNYSWLHHFNKFFSLILIFGHLVLLLASFDELNLIINYD